MEVYEINHMIMERALGLDKEVRDVESLDWKIKRQSSFTTEIAEVPFDWNLTALSRQGYMPRKCGLTGKVYIERAYKDWDKWADENCPEHLR